MTSPEYPQTNAVRFLRDHTVQFQGHFYPYEEHGGTSHAAQCLGLSEHSVIKTLVMETEERKPILVLMHGDCEVSTKALARILGTKRVLPCSPQTAQKHTGYLVGGTSPFGTRSTLPVYAEESIFSLPLLYINGGKKGFLVSLSPADLHRILPAVHVHVAIRP